MKKLLLLATSALFALCGHAEICTAETEVVPTIPGYTVTRITGPDQLKNGDKVLIRIHNSLMSSDFFFAVNSANETVGTYWPNITNVEDAIFDVVTTTGNISYTAPAPYASAEVGTTYYQFKHGDSYVPLKNNLSLSTTATNATARLLKVTELPACTTVSSTYNFAADENTNGYFMMNYSNNGLAYCYLPSGGKYGFNGQIETTNAIYYNGLNGSNRNGSVATAQSFAQQCLTPFFIFYKVEDKPVIPGATVTRVTNVDELKDGDKILIRIHNTLTNPDPYLAVNASDQSVGTNWADVTDYNSALYTVEESAPAAAYTTTFSAPYSDAVIGTKYYKFKHGAKDLTLHGSVNLSDSYVNPARLVKVTSLPACTSVANYNFAAETDNDGLFMLNITNSNVAYCNVVNNMYGFNSTFGGASGTIYYNGLKNAAANNNTPAVYAAQHLTPFFKIYKVEFLSKANYQDQYDLACEHFNSYANYAIGNEPGKYPVDYTAATAAKQALDEYWAGEEFSHDVLMDKIQAMNNALSSITWNLFDVHSIEGNALVRISISDGYAEMPDNTHVFMRGNKYYLSNTNATATTGVGVTTDATADETIYLLHNNTANRCALINYTTGHAIKANGHLGASAADNTPGSVHIGDHTASEIGAYYINMYDTDDATAHHLCTIWARQASDVPFFSLYSTGNLDNSLFNNFNLSYVTELTEGEEGVKTVWRAPVTVSVTDGRAYALYSDMANAKVITSRANLGTTYAAGTAFVLDGRVKFNVKNNVSAEAHALQSNTAGHHAKHSFEMAPGQKYLSTHRMVAAEQEVMLMALDDEEATEEDEEDDVADDVMRMHVYSVDEATTIELAAHAVVLKVAGEALVNGSTFDVELDKETDTSISEIRISETSAQGVYDLMGRRLTQPVKGAVNIINGKKTFVF